MDANTMLLAIGGAFWLGVLTSVSPCPMATNVAAIGYLARNSHSRMLQLLAGLLYAIGRAVAYTLAIQQESTWLLPAVFGIGSALPVLVFGILLTLARHSASRAFSGLQKIDRWLLPATGWLVTAIGLFLIIRQWLM